MSVSGSSFLDDLTHSTIAQLHHALQLADDTAFTASLPVLGDSSIGMHFRHIIEFMQCLQQGYRTGSVNYADRPRNRQLETDTAFAGRLLQSMAPLAGLSDLPVTIVHRYAADNLFVAQSTYHRELWYVLEHAIHHMALIKIGFSALDIELPAAFGVAPSTIQYRETCAL